MAIFRTDRLADYIQRHFGTVLPFITPLKALNVAACLVEMTLRRTRCVSRPFVYRVDPSTACNLRCPSCESHTVPTTEKRLLELVDFQTIIGKIRQLCLRVSLYDTGDPLVNKDIYKMIRAATAARVSTLISTSFTLFRVQRDIPRLFSSGLTVLAVSIDGVTQDSYSTYRKRGNVSRVKRSLESVLHHKRITGSHWPIVEAQVIDFQHLAPFKDSINQYCASVGVDKITWKQETWGFDGPIVNRPEDAGGRNRCFWLYTGPMIRPDGNVYPCCGRGFGRFAYGNILEQSVGDIWNNRYYRFSRSLFKRGPDIPFDPEMENLPCHACTLFRKRRRMLPRKIDDRAH
jgi:radical SAM protein with 4Fe4S-binding SPASM domain